MMFEGQKQQHSQMNPKAKTLQMKSSRTVFSNTSKVFSKIVYSLYLNFNVFFLFFFSLFPTQNKLQIDEVKIEFMDIEYFVNTNCDSFYSLDKDGSLLHIHFS